MLDVKPITNSDHFVHPVQSIKGGHGYSSNRIPAPVVITISATGQELLHTAPSRSLRAFEILKEKVRKILGQSFNEGNNLYRDEHLPSSSIDKRA